MTTNPYAKVQTHNQCVICGSTIEDPQREERKFMVCPRTGEPKFVVAFTHGECMTKLHPGWDTYDDEHKLQEGALVMAAQETE